MESDVKNYLNGLYGGKLINIDKEPYQVSIRIYDDKNKASLKFKKNNVCIFYHPVSLKMDVFGKLMNFIDNNEQEAKKLEQELWEILV